MTDAVSLHIHTPPFQGIERPTLSTQLEIPSVVEFWHRSQDLDGVTTLGVNRVNSGTSSVWRRHRMVAPAGRLEISNLANTVSFLYLDSVDIRPAALTSLAEALDWPFLVIAESSGNSFPPGDPGTVLGVTESWLALDGVDSILVSQHSTSIRAAVSGPALVSYRSRDAEENSGLQPQSGFRDGSPLPEFTSGDRTWFWMAGNGFVNFAVRSVSVPVLMDGLEKPAEVPVRKALDAPGLELELSGMAAGTPQVPPGASDGDAVLCLADPAFEGSGGGRISLKVNSPRVVRFEYLGLGALKCDGRTVRALNSSTWQTQELMVYDAPRTLTWEGSLWVNAVSAGPPPPGRSAGELLNAPGLVPEFPYPVYAEVMPGSVEGDEGLYLAPNSPQDEMTPVIHLPFQGPSVVSIWVSMSGNFHFLRTDGGPWQAASWAGTEPGRTFTAVVPGEGAHFLEVGGVGLLDRFQTVPLEEMPLAEALDAPGMVFTTSPVTPWKGYRVPEGMGLLGSHGATGGRHAAAGDPWIETRVEGPGVLEFRIRPYSLGTGYPPYNDRSLLSGVSVDGGSPQPVSSGLDGTPAGIPLGAGPHTVRWIQKGSQALDPLATSVWMDRVSFTAGTIPLSEALDTPGRGWTAHGAAGEVLPVVWAGGSPDGVDSVQLRSAGTRVETVVNLPARISFTGSNLLMTGGTGEAIINQQRAGTATFQLSLNGTGPARLRFSPAESGPAVLDQVVIFETTDRIAPAAVSQASGIGWRRVDGKPWSILSNPVTGETRYGAGNPAWMEAVVPGPCVIMASREMTLPDHGNRIVFGGKIHYPGPQRVLMAWRDEFGAPLNLFITDNYRPALDPVEAMKVSGLTWTTGGEAPWMCVAAGASVSAPVLPGEVSWIEAELTGPGVLRWSLNPLPSDSSGRIGDVTCDGVALPSAGLSYLHLTPGPHRVRWQAAWPVGGFVDNGSYVRLEDVGFQPQPTGSVTAVLGSPVNIHEELPVGSRYVSPSVVPWPAAHGWRPGSDAVTGAPVLEADYGAGALTALLPVPGTMTSQLKMERSGPLGIAAATTLPAAAAPFPWTPWTTRTPVWPLAQGYRTSVAGVAFVSYAPVSVGEALDKPGLDWTTGSNPPGLWKALTGITQPESSDPDALYLSGMAMGDTAWLETTVEGPLGVSVYFESLPSRLAPTFRTLLDGRPVTTFSPLRVPLGSHRLRWEVTARAPIPAGEYVVLRRAATVSSAPPPDVNALIDAPGLEWSLAGSSPTAVTAAESHDGVDALSFSGGSGVFSVSLQGPGVLSFWKNQSSAIEDPLVLDELSLLTGAPRHPGWRQFILPIPAGPHICQIRKRSSTTVLDEFDWQPLPAITPEEALDAPAGVTVTVPDPHQAGAAPWGSLSDDDTDSLLLMPDQPHRLEIKVPPQSTVSLRARSAYSTSTLNFTGYLGIQNIPRPVPVTTAWTTYTFSTGDDFGTGTVYLAAYTAPVLIDRLTVTTPPTGAGYFPWADGHGLATARNQPLDDPDSDGWSNLLEYSLGLDPTTADSAKAGTDTVPGTPETAVWTDPGTGLTYPEIRYWRRNGQTATVETAQDPEASAWMGDPAGWTPSPLPGTVTTPSPEGWSRVVWRSSEPVAAGGRVFMRVRYSSL
ncbi:MAG: hypothetical protein JWM59_2563 [Verrucomicrobiales bacterium]|nr:hypothetical protein [Verrucomicrobiales bacterium]